MITESAIRDTVGMGYKILLHMEVNHLVITVTSKTQYVQTYLPMSDHIKKADEAIIYAHGKLLLNEGQPIEEL